MRKMRAGDRDSGPLRFCRLIEPDRASIPADGGIGRQWGSLETAMKPIYLDYNATTPADPEVVEELLPYLSVEFGNPSSGHPYGKKAREAVELARARMAALLGCDRSEVIFTGGGTESNNQAIIGFAFANMDRGKHIISTTIEHPAVLKPLKAPHRRARLFGHAAPRRRNRPPRPRFGPPGRYPRHHSYQRHARKQ